MRESLTRPKRRPLEVTKDSNSGWVARITVWPRDWRPTPREMKGWTSPRVPRHTHTMTDIEEGKGRKVRKK